MQLLSGIKWPVSGETDALAHIDVTKVVIMLSLHLYISRYSLPLTNSRQGGHNSLWHGGLDPPPCLFEIQTYSPH